MLSIEKCKQLLKQSGKTYTDDEIKQIRKLLYKICELDYHLFTQKKLKDAERNHLHKGVNR
jgi:hypothetical protein